MNNFKSILQEQQKALSTDIENLVEEIKSKELELEALKDTKSQASSTLKSIEKKLSKL